MRDFECTIADINGLDPTSVLTIVYHMLNDGTCYQDLGPEYFARRNPAKIAAKLADRIRNLGFQVEIRAAA